MSKGIRRSEVLVPLCRGVGIPLRVQLIRGLRVAIQSGRLTPGSPLPSTRVLAMELGLSRGVLVDAYEQLAAEGYVLSHRGSSSVVADRPTTRLPVQREPDSRGSPRYDFRPGRPDHELFPRRAWLSAVRRALTTAPATAFDYSDARGAPRARDALSSYLNRSRATATTAERIVLCTGFAQGMRLVCETLRARGIRRIAVEDPGHAYESPDVRASGLELIPVPVDEGGLRVERLEKLTAGVVYITPAHQYPTGAVLAPSRRSGLLAWAEKRGAFIIEDDYDGEYRYDREPIGAMQGLAPERVIYIGSASKILAPALRLGWLASPQCLLPGLSRAKLEADRGSPELDQLALAEFIEHGDLDRHLRRTRRIYSRRRAQLAGALAKHLPGYPILGVAAGLHLTLGLPNGTDESSTIAEAARAGISLYGLSGYRARPRIDAPALLLGYCRLAEDDIDTAAKALATLIKSARVTRVPGRAGGGGASRR
jgi:GntR family transcriptional regulator / MocR family aminotransferase